MHIYDLITQDELDNAPEDPATAFTQLVGFAQRRLSKYIGEADTQNEGYLIEEAQHRFMNVIIGLAKAYQIDPFATLDVPRRKHFSYEDYSDFSADLDHYMTQLLVANSIKTKSDSVTIAPEVKDKIRTYVASIKEQIDSSSLTDSKKADLHKKLRDFETELDKNRVPLIAVTRLAFVLLSVPGALYASYDVVSKLTTNVLQIVGEAKATEDDNRKLPEDRPMPALSPPRKEENEEITRSTDLDDEIPF